MQRGKRKEEKSNSDVPTDPETHKTRFYFLIHRSKKADFLKNLKAVGEDYGTTDVHEIIEYLIESYNQNKNR